MTVLFKPSTNRPVAAGQERDVSHLNVGRGPLPSQSDILHQWNEIAQPMNAYPHSEPKTAERKMYFIGCVLFNRGLHRWLPTWITTETCWQGSLLGQALLGKYCSASIARAFLEGARCRGPPTTFKPPLFRIRKSSGKPALFARPLLRLPDSINKLLFSVNQ